MTLLESYIIANTHIRAQEVALKQLQEDKEELINTLEAVVGLHNPPGDCYSTRPFQGDMREAERFLQGKANHNYP